MITQLNKQNHMFYFAKILSSISTKYFALAFVSTASLLTFVEKYIFSDWSYLKFLMIACVVDLATGVTKVWVKEGSKAITSKGLRNTIAKVVQYGAFIIITHVLTNFEVDGEKYIEFVWVNKGAYIALILIEVKSVYENIVEINPKFNFLKPLMDKLDGRITINKSGDEKN